jgi:replicative DNA helicase
MADFFDSSVLIGLLLADCPEHAACAEAWMRSSERVVCSHGLLETFSQLTGGRLGDAVPPDAASESITRTMRAGLVRVMVFDSEELFSHLESTRRVGARGGARAGGKVLLVSAEMLSSSIMARLVCSEAGLPLTAYTRGGYEDEGGRWCRLGKAQLDQLADAARLCGALPIHWDHHSRTIGAIRTQARRLQRAKGGGLDLIVVDYLTRLKAEGKSDNRHVEITGLVKGLKDTAMALGVPIVLLSQLSRKVDGRDDKMPTLGDLRESGSIEEESDAVIFLHREHYYLMRGKPARGPKERAADYDQRVLEWQDALHRSCGRAVAYIAKQRQGRIGPVDLRWDDATAMFMDDDMPGGA